MTGWLKIHRGSAPLILTFPHTGTEIPPPFQEPLASLWLGRKDADWWPPNYDSARAQSLREVLTSVLQACLEFATVADPTSSSAPQAQGAQRSQ